MVTHVEATLTDVMAIKAELRRRLEPARRCPTPRSAVFAGAADQYLDCVPRIACAGGLTVSVQTGPSHYCTPRDGYGPWSAVELGFPSRRIEEFVPYIDGALNDDPTDTVYGYVPLHIVAEAIAADGGLLPEGANVEVDEADGAA